MSVYWQGGFGAGDFAEELEQSSAKTRRESKKEFRRMAETILQTSRDGAPIDEGDLEKAHHIQTIRLSKDNIALELSVGGMVGDTDVSVYAMLMHEGDYNLGLRSQQKEAAGSTEVGPFFMDRAADEHIDDLMAIIERTLPGD